MSGVTTLTLPEFLLARIAEDDFAAFSAAQDEELLGALHEHAIASDDHRKTHAARWSPARVRTFCEARQRIVELHTDDETPTICPVCHWQAGYDMLNELAPCQTLRLLALPYAGHRDYRAEEWAP